MTINVVPIEGAAAQFAHPYIDADEMRSDPAPHRYIHGGFAGTTTRFALYYPPAGVYQGRFLQNPGGGFDGPENELVMIEMGLFGSLKDAFETGCYLVSSNAFSGYNSEPDDSTYGVRASVAAALQSRQIAHEIYGEQPHHGYIWGGSASGRRTLDCVETTEGVWDGAVPFMTFRPAEFALWANSVEVNARRVLGSKVEAVIDALEPGGSGNPFDGLDEDQRRELAALMRIGYPRGAEFLLRDPQAVVRGGFISDQDTFFERFWSEPGFAGHDRPDLTARYVVNTTATVARILTGRDLADRELLTSLGGDDPQVFVTVAGIPVQLSARFGDLPVAVVLDRPLGCHGAGAHIVIKSGRATGRALITAGTTGPLLVAAVAGSAEALLAFTDVQAGDEVGFDNRAAVAYGFLHRHLGGNPVFDVDGTPMYPQQPVDRLPWNVGSGNGQIRDGKVILVHHAQDPVTWPPGIIEYDRMIREFLGDQAHDRYRMWFTERAEHVFPPMKSEGPVPVHSSRVINYVPVIWQAIHDMIAWCEQGIAPASDTRFELTADNELLLADTAEARGGIQPVISAPQTVTQEPMCVSAMR
jgi:hypothetical protein